LPFSSPALNPDTMSCDSVLAEALSVLTALAPPTLRALANPNSANALPLKSIGAWITLLCWLPLARPAL
jgi:hypothetical protein